MDRLFKKFAWYLQDLLNPIALAPKFRPRWLSTLPTEIKATVFNKLFYSDVSLKKDLQKIFKWNSKSNRCTKTPPQIRIWRKEIPQSPDALKGVRIPEKIISGKDTWHTATTTADQKNKNSHVEHIRVTVKPVLRISFKAR